MNNKTRSLSAILVHSLTCVFAFLCFSLSAARAQPDDNGGEPASSDVPLDGGIAWLAAGGAVCAYRFLWRGREIEKEKTQRIDK